MLFLRYKRQWAKGRYQILDRTDIYHEDGSVKVRKQCMPISKFEDPTQCCGERGSWNTGCFYNPCGRNVFNCGGSRSKSQQSRCVGLYEYSSCPKS